MSCCPDTVITSQTMITTEVRRLSARGAFGRLGGHRPVPAQQGASVTIF
jgi:hypothetical protein